MCVIDERIKRHFSTHLKSVSAVTFLIDASDDEQLKEAAYELDALIGGGGAAKD